MVRECILIFSSVKPDLHCFLLSLIDLDETEILEKSGTIQTDNNALIDHLPPLIESQTIQVPNQEYVSIEKTEPSPCNGSTSNQQKLEEFQGKSFQRASGPNNLNTYPSNHSDAEATSAGDGIGILSSEDSENENLDGEQLQKKRKLDIDGAKEEDKITQEWDNDMRLIKRNLGRISRLFEVYDGYRDRKNLSIINPNLIIPDSIKTEQSNAMSNDGIELTKLQTTIAIIPISTQSLEGHQLLDDYKTLTEELLTEKTSEEKLI